jgi:hypothetical protein
MTLRTSLLATVLGLATLAHTSLATSVYFTRNPQEAHYRVYFTNYVEDADYKVHFSSSPLYGKCVLTRSSYETADVILYQTSKKSEADLVLFETSYWLYASQGCPF